jgi:AraC-like DNA-binding protein
VPKKSSNQNIFFSRLGSLQPSIRYFERRGLPVQKYLRQVGISDVLMSSPERPIPKSLHWKFVTTACDDDEIDHIGLLVGRESSLEELGEVGEFLLNSRTIGEYLAKGTRFINTLSSGEYYWLADEADQVRFCVSIFGLQENHTIQNYFFTLLITINTIRMAAGDDWCPVELNVPAMKARAAAELAEYFPDTKISRHGDYASILMPSVLLEQPLAKSSKPLAVPSESLPPDFKDSITETIKILIFAGRPELQNAVDISGLSARTFQRKLEKIGVNYTELVLEARIGIAMQWLENGDIPINKISEALGYRSPANFSRAFRGLVGQSPGAYRCRRN